MNHCVTLALLAMTVLACANNPMNAKEDTFGKSVRSAIAAQTVHADEHKQTSPLFMDGQAAKSSIDKYQKTFETTPPSAAVFTMGSGTR